WPCPSPPRRTPSLEPSGGSGYRLDTGAGPARMSGVPVRHSALLAMGVVAVSFSAIFIRLAHAPALTVALYRNAFAAAVVVPAGDDVLPLIGAAAAGGYFVAGRKLRQELSLLASVALVYSTCALLLWTAAILSGARLTGFPGRTWGLFVLMAAVSQMLGRTVF